MYKASFVALLIAITSITGCDAFKTPEERFWIWFEKNATEIESIESAGKPGIAQELSEELKKVDPGLTYEIGGFPGQTREFIISADGISSVVPAVKRLAEIAPDIPGWEIIAFRPRQGTDFSIKFDHIELSPEDIWFTAEEDGNRLGLILYLPNLDSEHRNTVVGASFIMLDIAIGEYDVITKIGFIEHKQVPDNPKDHGLRSFDQLAQTVDSYFNEQ